MRLFAALVSIAALSTAAPGPSIPEGDTVNELIDFYATFESKLPFFKKLKAIDLKCIKEKGKVNQNGEKIIEDIMFILTFIPIAAICSGNAHEFGRLMVDSVVDHSERRNTAINTECLMQALQQLDPEAVVLKNFDNTTITLTAEECESAVDKKGFDRMVDRIEHAIGSIDELTCGIFERQELFKEALKLPIIANINLEPAVEKAARDELAANFAKRVDKWAECGIDKLAKLENNTDN